MPQNEREQWAKLRVGIMVIVSLAIFAIGVFFISGQEGPMNILILAALSLIPLLGLILLGRGGREVWRGMASTQWPQTRGVVLASEVSENTSTYLRTHTTSTMYSSKVTVGYKVNGKEYQTSTLHFGQGTGSSDPSEAEMARLRYPPGAEVVVAYHPRDPALAALKPGFTVEALTLPCSSRV